MFGAIKRAFRTLDTTEVDAAIDAAKAAHQGVRVRARALRIGIVCPDAQHVIQEVGAKGAKGFPLRKTFGAVVDQPIPQSMQSLLNRI